MLPRTLLNRDWRKSIFLPFLYPVVEAKSTHARQYSIHFKHLQERSASSLQAVAVLTDRDIFKSPKQFLQTLPTLAFRRYQGWSQLELDELILKERWNRNSFGSFNHLWKGNGDKLPYSAPWKGHWNNVNSLELILSISNPFGESTVLITTQQLLINCNCEHTVLTTVLYLQPWCS